MSERDVALSVVREALDYIEEHPDAMDIDDALRDARAALDALEDDPPAGTEHGAS